MASTRTVNYSVRVGKHVERQMVIETMRRLDRLPPRLSSYGYVGFGGIFYADFLLVHRYLGIDSMISIEKGGPERFTFNRPLSCISLRFGQSLSVLPRVLSELRKAATPAILWLDYDGPVTSAVVADARSVASSALPLSMFLVTMNCEPGFDESRRVSVLSGQMDGEVPPDVNDGAKLGGWKLADVSHRLVQGAIDDALNDRNLALPDEERVQYRQLMRFHYSDGARMLTFGGLFHLPEQRPLVDDAFAGLAHIRGLSDEPLSLEVPVLTAREVRHLLEQMPAGDSTPTSPGVPDADVAKFVEVYKWYPLYAEIGGQQ